MRFCLFTLYPNHWNEYFHKCRGSNFENIVPIQWKEAYFSPSEEIGYSIEFWFYKVDTGSIYPGKSLESTNSLANH